MAKRFSDTEKWKKPFIRGLPSAYKLLWFYILDDCDHAGIWQADFEVARIRIGEQVDIDTAIRLFDVRIYPITKFKWFIPDFITFQYGELSEKNRMHKHVMEILDKHGLGAFKALPRGQGTIQGKGTSQGQGEGKRPASKVDVFEEIFSDELYVEQLAMTHKGKDLKQAFEECYTHHSNAPNPPQELWEWKQKLNTWLTIKRNDKPPKNSKQSTGDLAAAWAERVRADAANREV